MIEALVRMPASEALGWALLHSLWQGAIAALFVALVRSSRARYIAGCLALVGLLCIFTFTFWQCLPVTGRAIGSSRIAAALSLERTQMRCLRLLRSTGLSWPG